MSENKSLPNNIHCSKSHEYVLIDVDVATIGITHYAADQLGEVVYVELPTVGTKFEKGDTFGSVESVKAASELYMPISGTIVAVNEDLTSEPEMINDDCYTKGWLIKVKDFKADDLQDTLSADDYLAYTEE